MKKIIFICFNGLFLCFASCCIATGQAPVAQSDQITDDGTQQIIQDDSSSTGKFETVTVDPSANSDVALQFPVSLASKTVTIAALDGGTLTERCDTPVSVRMGRSRSRFKSAINRECTASS